MGNRKRPRNPTRKQKIILEESGLNWENWLILYEDFETLMAVHKQSGKERAIRK